MIRSVHTLIIKSTNNKYTIKKYIELDVWSSVWQNLRHLSSLVGLLLPGDSLIDSSWGRFNFLLLFPHNFLQFGISSTLLIMREKRNQKISTEYVSHSVRYCAGFSPLVVLSGRWSGCRRESPRLHTRPSGDLYSERTAEPLSGCPDGPPSWKTQSQTYFSTLFFLTCCFISDHMKSSCLQ